MKNIIKSTAIFMAMMLFAGCEAFLDTESFTDRNTSNFPASETDAMQLVTGIYSTLKVPTSTPLSSYWMSANAASDECYGGGGSDDIEIQAVNYLLTCNFNMHGELWESYYQGIARANMAIANLDKVEDETLRNQLLGEAYFLRSFFYFELTQLFGEVPLVATIPTNVEEAAKYPAQSSIEEIYGTIAAGLYEAAEIMPSKPWNATVSGLRHATRWDAEALLARVYLFYTGFYSDKNGKTITDLPLVDLETGELLAEGLSKAAVIKKLEDCINNSGHRLVEDYRELWPYSNVETKRDYDYVKDMKGEWYTDETNPEAMFQFCVTHLGSSSESNRINQYVGIRARDNYETNGFPFSQGYGWITVNPYIYNNWYNEEPNDPRRDASIWNVAVEGNDTYTWGNDNQVEESGLWQKKYQAYGFIHPDTGKFWKEFASSTYYGGPGTKDLGRKYSGQNVQIIRFADVLLMHSELTETADNMNKVRARVGLPAKAYSKEAIQMERRHELAFEATRWSDMRRYGKEYAIAALMTQKDGVIRNSGKEATMKESGSGWAKRYTETYGFFPLPQTEVDLSDGVLTQNAGWTTGYQYTSHY